MANIDHTRNLGEILFHGLEVIEKVSAFCDVHSNQQRAVIAGAEPFANEVVGLALGRLFWFLSATRQV